MQIGQLQDALQALRDSVKVSLQEAAGEREQYEAQAIAKAAEDKALHEVCSPVFVLVLSFQHHLCMPRLDWLCTCLACLGATVEKLQPAATSACVRVDMLHCQHAACLWHCVTW